MSVEVSVQVIVILKQIMKGNSCLVVPHKLEVDFDEMIVRFQDELVKSGFQFFEVFEVFEPKLHHWIWIVDFFVLVQNIKPFQVFAFFVASNLLLLSDIALGSA